MESESSGSAAEVDEDIGRLQTGLNEDRQLDPAEEIKVPASDHLLFG
jgi:hypothetical protein